MPSLPKLLLLAFLVIAIIPVVAQSPVDTLRAIEIIYARSQRQISRDTTVFQTLAGNASIRQGNTIVSGDSIILNQRTGIAEVFGNVHVNDADTLHTYAQYLKYVGNERVAFLKRGVKLTDGRATLTTEDLEYNLASGIANYRNGGRVVNETTILNSTSATYYSDTKDVFFKDHVHLVDPKYNMTADSLRYNTEFKTAYFISPTHIISKDGIIDTRSGSYNLESGNAIFDQRSSFKDSTSYLSGDQIAFEEKTGVIQIEGRGKFVDSINKVIVLGDQLLIDKKNSTFLATRKPVMIFFRGTDSTYISADTLYSGFENKQDTAFLQAAPKRDTRFVITGTEESQTLADTLFFTNLDQPRPVNDSLTPPLRDSAVFIVESGSRLPEMDTARLATEPHDTSRSPVLVDLNNRQSDSIRYFIGFHHVRIYNDSAQAVSDSMHFSTFDSTFKLFGSPVFWNAQTQVKGDTMHLYTENREAKRVYVFFNGIVINRTHEGFFNQMGGRTINGYFKEGSVDYVRVKGSPAESIFYPQDDDSAYVGMNRSKGDVIDIFFVKDELNRIKFINDVDGTLYPLRQVPPEQKYLKNFSWEDKRRPKNKLELFE